MLQFHQIILRKIIFLFSILFAALSLMVFFWVKSFYIEQTKESLLKNISIIALALENNPNLDKIAKSFKNDLGLRLTLITNDGTVIAESHKNKYSLENHKHRKEILQARTQEYGFIIRHSKSIGKDFLYVAKKFPYKNGFIYIRVSQELNSINGKIHTLGAAILTLFAFFFLVLFVATYRMSSVISAEVQKIATFLTSLTKKKKSTYITSDLSMEFASITSLLTKVSQILVKREKQKSKFTAKLQSSNKQKDDIISAISHEFKNPIAVINGYSQTLIDDADINSQIRHKFLTKIFNNGVKLSELIDTLRLSSKLDSGQQSAQFKKINLSTLIHETVENITLNYSRREVIINGDATLEIQADATLFGVVITNLVENAFKYSEDEVVLNFNKNYLEVIDTGIGISEKNIENITNKFYRVHSNSWNNSLGLGLFIVRNIIDLHKFSLHISSIENEGSTFKIKF